MVTKTREGQLLETFVTLADTLVADYDVVDLLHTLVEKCVALLEASAAGIILSAGDGELEVMASTNERSRLVEILQLRAGSGPCVESFTTGLGHGVGLQIHEDPFITNRDAGKIEARTVMTMEPGIYLPGRGGVRIEDTVVVTSGAPEVLTTMTKDLLELA